jgi:hypothetical protein
MQILVQSWSDITSGEWPEYTIIAALWLVLGFASVRMVA